MRRAPTSSLVASGVQLDACSYVVLSVSSGENVRRARGERVLTGLERVGCVGSCVSVVRWSSGA